MRKAFLLAVLVGGFAALAGAQPLLDKTLSLSFKETPLEEVLLHLLQEEDIPISFQNRYIPKVNVSVRWRRQPLGECLRQLTAPYGLTYNVVQGQIIITPQTVRAVPDEITLSGFVKDARTGEAIIGAGVLAESVNREALSNEYGYFSLKVPGGRQQLRFSYLGYDLLLMDTLLLMPNTSMTIVLQSQVTLPEVVVLAKNLPDPISGLASGHEISNAETKLLPALGGEPDIIRVAHLLPGITTGTDGAQGLQIRGGSSDQNLVLLDGVPVYDVSHAIGLFSIFNTQAVRSTQILKGGFPARYGGRLSGVMDIRTREGNMQHFEGSAETGLLSSRVLVEGPLVRNKSSVLLAGRWSFIHWILQPESRKFKQNRGRVGSTDYRFYDLNLKVNYILSVKDRVYLSWYAGKDRYFDENLLQSQLSIVNSQGTSFLYQVKQDFSEGNNWGNELGALRWNHLFSDRLFANFTFTFSNLSQNAYYSNVDSLFELTTAQRLVQASSGDFTSGIKDYGIRADWQWLPGKDWELRFGLGYNHRIFNPGALIVTNEDITTVPFANSSITTHEVHQYLEAAGQWSEKLHWNIGVFNTLWQVRDKYYPSIQPRAALHYQLKPAIYLKASAGKMVQFLHRLTNSSVSLPSDLWVPSTNAIAPAKSWQSDLGFGFLPSEVWALEWNVYYKYQTNLLSFKEGVEAFEDWEENVTSGQGEAYGTEVLLRKGKGNLNGWVAYTLARAVRQFPDINLGRTFPFRYDRRHDFKAVATYRINEKLTASANWLYSSGFAFTLPLVSFPVGIPGQPRPGGFNPGVLDPVATNNYRMPPYHRLDVNLHWEWASKRLKHELNLGIYNVYNRVNPLYYNLRRFYVNNNSRLEVQYAFVEVQLTTVLPVFSYKIAF